MIILLGTILSLRSVVLGAVIKLKESISTLGNFK